MITRHNSLLLLASAAVAVCCQCTANKPDQQPDPSAEPVDITPYKGLIINEVAAHDEIDGGESWIELLNGSSATVDLKEVGIYLYDEYFEGKELWKGTDATLAAGERLVLRTADESLKTGFASNADFKLRLGVGEADIDVFERSKAFAEPKAIGERGSYQRIPDGGADWRNLTYSSPGRGNEVFNYKTTIPNCVWVWNSHVPDLMDNDAAKLKNLHELGYRHILLNAAALNDNFKARTFKFLDACEELGITVHAWMQCFYNGGWVNPIDDENNRYKEEEFERIRNSAKRYIEQYGVQGLHLDYIRFGGTASKHNPSAEVNALGAVNRVCREIREIADSFDEGIVTSAALMPEPNTNYAYAQDPSQMGKYLHILMPMTYRYSYHMSDERVKTVTKWFVDNAADAEVWSGMQTYYGDDNGVTPMEADAIRADMELYKQGGSTGIVLFRYQLGTFPDVNDLWN